MPYIPGQGRIQDVYHSPNVFVNNVEIALWKENADTAAFIAGLLVPSVSYVLEQADVDAVTEENTATTAQVNEAVISYGTGTGILTEGTGVMTSSTVAGPVDTTPPASVSSTTVNADWSQFNQDNIPYETLMLTPKTSLATFTIKAALWNNQPNPHGPNTPFTSGNTKKGDNKYIKAQYGLTVPQILSNLANLAQNVYEPIKQKYPSVIITNTFRQGPPGGAKEQAQHGRGQAMDIVFPGFTTNQYYDAAIWIRDNIPFDQLLQEKAGGTVWIHISHYSGFGTQVPKQNKVANCFVSPTYSFVPGLAPLA